MAGEGESRLKQNWIKEDSSLYYMYNVHRMGEKLENTFTE